MKNGDYRPVEILLAEDNEDDVFLTLNAFSRVKVRNNIHVVPDGVKALQYLRGEEEYAGAPRPDLILMDLNMPRMDGHSLLAEIKKDPALKSIPVVILTASEARDDVEKNYGLQASCYIIKPMKAEDFDRILERLADFWLLMVTLPRAPDPENNKGER